jgi:hypothetical protein
VGILERNVLAFPEIPADTQGMLSWRNDYRLTSFFGFFYGAKGPGVVRNAA